MRFFSSPRKSRPTVRKPAGLRVEGLEDRSVPATMVGLTTVNRLVTFDTAAPAVIQKNLAVTGLTTNETIQSLDARPANGLIYGLSSLNRLYTIDLSSGRATPAGAANTDLPLTSKNLAIDFNPTVDRLRIVTDTDQNFRINPVTGVVVDGNVNPGTQPDASLSYNVLDANVGKNPAIGAVAYDRNFQGSTLTTLFGIDGALRNLVRVGGPDGTPSPNGGQLETVGGLGVPLLAKSAIGFDVTADGVAYATLTSPTRVAQLYTINLATGAATAVGRVGAGNVYLRAMTALPREETVFAVTASNRLISFKANDPNTLLSAKALRGLLAGESVASIDFRPASGELYAVTTQNRVLTVNTATATATQAGVPLDAAALAAGSGTTINFNPAVDRLRVVNTANDNVRFNPLTSALVTPADADLAYAAGVGDPNEGEVPNVVGAAYDRNDNDPATPTTLFGIDATNDVLVRQGGVDGSPSPNGGALSTVGALGVDAADVASFDIVGNGTNGSGAALAALQLQGETVSKFYSLNVSASTPNQPQGGVTLIGAIGVPELVVAMAVAPSTIQFAAAATVGRETGGMVAVVLTRTGGSAGTATVRFDAYEGTAVDGLDFTAVSQVVTFNPGETRKIVMVPLLRDRVVEAAETIQMTLSAVTGGTTVLGDQDTSTLVILNV